MWEISWANLMMYSASIPSYDKDEKDDDDKPVQQIEEEDVAAFFKF